MNMLKNYISVAWRNLIRNKLHTAINITSLCIGITASLVITLIVHYEFSFNKGFSQYDKIYRIHSTFSENFSALNRGIPTGVAPVLREQFTGIDQVVQFHLLECDVRVNEVNIQIFKNQQNIIITDPAYFTVFSDYEWIAGSSENLTDPFKTVITESKALTYFGKADESILGKEIIYQDSLHTTVVGIVKDLPFTNDFYFKDFISYSTIEKSFLRETIVPDDWSSVNSSSQVFFSVKENTQQQKIEDQIPLLLKLAKEKNAWDGLHNFQVQSLAALHFDIVTGIFDHSRSPAHLPTLFILLLVAALLLAVGIINFINLVTAQSIRRAKEVGVRKVLGSTRSKLITQFISESFMVTLCAVLLAIPMAELSLYYFKEFLSEGVTLNLNIALPVLLILLLVVSVAAGFYPAFVLSSYTPATVLKQHTAAGNQFAAPAFLRKTLIVFQFTFAQILIMGTIIIGNQVRYMLSKDLGFTSEAILYMYTPWHLPQQKTQILKDELSKLPGIEKASLSTSPASERGWNSTTITYKNDSDTKKVSVFLKHGDEEYLNLYNIKILAGRNLSPSDTVKEILINETLMKAIGFTNPHDVIGQQIELSQATLPVIGVIQDFHFQSLHAKVEPVVAGNRQKSFYCINLKLENSNNKEIKSTLARIDETIKKVYPDEQITYRFMDDIIKSFYETEKRTTKLVNTATTLAILISCLGLFGLASYAVEQRTKEIGIRKVLGASTENIVLLLSKNFLVLVITAFFLAAPIAWLTGNHWLERYPYRIHFDWWILPLTGLFALAIAIVIVSTQAIRAAVANPVNSLKNE
jgi:putative ABC transport system permease protein